MPFLVMDYSVPTTTRWMLGRPRPHVHGVLVIWDEGPSVALVRAALADLDAAVLTRRRVPREAAREAIARLAVPLGLVDDPFAWLRPSRMRRPMCTLQIPGAVKALPYGGASFAAALEQVIAGMTPPAPTREELATWLASDDPTVRVAGLRALGQLDAAGAPDAAGEHRA